MFQYHFLVGKVKKGIMDQYGQKKVQELWSSSSVLITHSFEEVNKLEYSHSETIDRWVRLFYDSHL